jgi:hypothetical protein
MMSSIVLLLGHLLGAQDNYVEATHWLYFYTSAFFISVVLVVRSLFTAVLDSAYSAEEENFYGTRTFCVFSSFIFFITEFLGYPYYCCSTTNICVSLITVSGKGSNRKGKEEQGYCADCTKHGPRTWLELAFNARHAYNAMMDYGREMPSNNNGMNGDVDDADDEMRDGDEDAEI